MKKIFGRFILIMMFAPFASKGQTVLISGASNPYVKYNFMVGDTLYYNSRVDFGTYYAPATGLRTFYNGVGLMNLTTTGSAFSLSDNTVFDNQLSINTSHNGTAQDGGYNSTTFSNAGYGNTITGRMAGGTGVSPTATPLNSKLIELTGKGYTGAAFSTSNTAEISFRSVPTFSLAN